MLFVGLTIENALAERVDVTVGPKNHRESRSKYTITQLLDDRFRLPPPARSTQPANPLANYVAQLQTYAGSPRSGIKVWKYVGKAQ